MTFSLSQAIEDFLEHIRLFLTSISPDSNHVFELLLFLMLVIWLSGRLFRSLKLPPVLGEILAGVLVGPAVLGIVQDNDIIRILAELGVFFLMLHTGIDTNSKEFFRHAKLALPVAVFTIIPLATASFFLVHSFLGFELLPSLFMAFVVPLNSIPVIISLLKGYDINKTRIGHTALGATVANELILFVGISGLIAVAQMGEFSLFSLLFVVLKIFLFFSVTLLVGIKILPSFSSIFNENGKKGFTFAMIVGLSFGLFAEIIGLHMILGAYLAGIFIRQQITNETIMKKIEDRFYGLSYSFLGPVFFAFVGMTISFDILWEHPFFIFLLFLMMVGIQWIFSGSAARYLGKFSWAESSLVALSLTGRGGTEIIVAQIGLTTIIVGSNSPLLPESLFSSIVLLAFLTTLIAPFLMRPFVKRLQKEEE